MKAAFPYFGGKNVLAPWVISHFPLHEIFVDLFGGAANISLAKKPARLDVYNDIYDDVVNFFRVLRDRPDDLIRAIDLTPYARKEHELSKLAFFPVDFTDVKNELERARLFYVLLKQTIMPGYARTTGGGMAWRARTWTTRATVQATWNRTQHPYDIADRLKILQIDSVPYQDAIARYDTADTLFYADPPYYKATRKDKGNVYTHEMNTEEDHRELAEKLNGIDGMAILSGYPSALYNELFASWQCVTKDAQDGTNETRTEALWINPRAQLALQETVQKEMF